jgi:hypothetical protein
MAKRIYKVVAHLPATVELSRRATKDTLTVDVDGGQNPGKLVIAQGSIEWWPGGNKVNAHRLKWDAFAAMIENIPERPSKKKSKAPKK